MRRKTLTTENITLMIATINQPMEIIKKPKNLSKKMLCAFCRCKRSHGITLENQSVEWNWKKKNQQLLCIIVGRLLVQIVYGELITLQVLTIKEENLQVILVIIGFNGKQEKVLGCLQDEKPLKNNLLMWFLDGICFGFIE